jgi:DNA polymerase III epsilon subunit-like protein
MSISNWRSTLVARPDLKSDLGALVTLAGKLNKTITVFDLEATTFRGKINFGITEVGMVHVNPNGDIAVAGDYVNPEHRIDRTVSELTGIRHEHVKDKPNWKEGWSEFFLKAGTLHVIAGFNSRSFDVPAIADMHERYKVSPFVVHHNWDIRNMSKHAFESEKGTLAEVARWLELSLDGFNAHRASDDAILTARVLSALIDKYPESLPSIEVNTGKYASLSPIYPSTKSSTGKNMSSTSVPSTRNATKATPRATLDGPKPMSMTAAIEHVLQTQIQRFKDTPFVWSIADTVALVDHVVVLNPTLLEDKTKFDIYRSLTFPLGMYMDKGLLPLAQPVFNEATITSNPDLVKAIHTQWSTSTKLQPVFELMKSVVPDASYLDVRWILHRLKLKDYPMGVTGSNEHEFSPR